MFMFKDFFSLLKVIRNFIFEKPYGQKKWQYFYGVTNTADLYLGIFKNYMYIVPLI